MEPAASGPRWWDGAALARWWRLNAVGTIDHQAVAARVTAESGWSPRYLFMVMMSAGIAVLGLLLSSPAVVIGAMLISPLMSPILGLGFGLAMFDFAEVRRAAVALVAGAAVAALFTMAVVLASPLKAATAEILSRTRPNLFDLLVALFASLAGTFAIIRGKGDTIVGVAIATALMPPLAVVGYGLATWNISILGGSLALFVTNFVTIALSATIMARLYGFGHALSDHQSWLQTIVLLLAFVLMAIPLGISLRHIAGEALTVSDVRSFLGDRFGATSRVTQLDVDFDSRPIKIRAVVIAPKSRAVASTTLRQQLAARLNRPVALQIDEVLLDPNAGIRDREAAERTAEQKASQQVELVEREQNMVANLVATAAGIPPAAVTVDSARQRVLAAAAPLPGASLASYRALEARAQAGAPGWQVWIAPPVGALPSIHFSDGSDAIDPAARASLDLVIWAATRWNVRQLAVPGLPAAEVRHPKLVQRRAIGIADALRAAGLTPLSAPGGGQDIRPSVVTTP